MDSQFFITFTSTPHLNAKHVVFGRMVSGRNVLDEIEQVTVGTQNRPIQHVTIQDCGQILPDPTVPMATEKQAEKAEKQTEKQAEKEKGKTEKKKKEKGDHNKEEIDIGAFSSDDEDQHDEKEKEKEKGRKEESKLKSKLTIEDKEEKEEKEEETEGKEEKGEKKEKKEKTSQQTPHKPTPPSKFEWVDEESEEKRMKERAQQKLLQHAAHHNVQHHIQFNENLNQQKPAQHDASEPSDPSDTQEDDMDVLASLPRSSNPKLAERINKLANTRLSMNQARAKNRRDVAEEHKRFNKGPKQESKSRYADYKEKQEAWKQEMVENQQDPNRPFLYETAERVEAREEKKKHKKDPNEYGFDALGSQYMHFEKRLSRVRKSAAGNDPIQIRDLNSLEYAIDQRPPEANIDHMVQELAETEKRRSRFSRRRPFNEDADITYINERNRVFNKKIKRAYEKYTLEIKNNLERGTALWHPKIVFRFFFVISFV